MEKITPHRTHLLLSSTNKLKAQFRRYGHQQRLERPINSNFTRTSASQEYIRLKTENWKLNTLWYSTPLLWWMMRWSPLTAQHMIQSPEFALNIMYLTYLNWFHNYEPSWKIILTLCTKKSDYVRSTLLHHAAVSRSSEFCQVLISLNEDLVRALDIFENLPFHAACRSANINTAKYLYRLYP